MLTQIEPNFGIRSSRDHWIPEVHNMRNQEDFGMYDILEDLFELTISNGVNRIAEAGWARAVNN